MGIVDKFVDSIKKDDLHTLYVQVRKNGEIVDQWSRFSIYTRMESYSTSKTFCALGLGIAEAEGLISLDEKPADFFPEYTYDITEPNCLDITVRDMLIMSSGLKEKLITRDDPRRQIEKDWIDYFYHHGEFIRRPGEKFLYENSNTYMPLGSGNVSLNIYKIINDDDENPNSEVIKPDTIKKSSLSIGWILFIVIMSLIIVAIVIWVIYEQVRKRKKRMQNLLPNDINNNYDNYNNVEQKSPGGDNYNPIPENNDNGTYYNKIETKDGSPYDNYPACPPINES